MNETRARLLVVDVDGTLLDSHHNLSRTNIDALRRAADHGIAIALATGRRHAFVLPIAQQLPFDTFLITSNGALIRTASGDVLFSRCLQRNVAAVVLAALPDLRAQAVLTFRTEGVGELVMESPDQAQRTFAGWLDRNLAYVRWCKPLEKALVTDPVQVMFGGHVAQIEAAASVLDAACGAQVRLLRTLYPKRNLGILDILHRAVSKGAALNFLARRLGCGRDAVVAIGDNFNDIEMLEAAGMAIVMGNAHPEMMRTGWLQTLDNDHDGVAAAIDHYLLTVEGVRR